MKVGFQLGANKEVHNRWSAGKFWIFSLLKCFKYQLRDIFQTMNKVLTEHSDYFPIKESITNRVTPGRNFISEVAENMPSGVDNSTTSTGSEGCHTPPHSHPTATGMLIIDSKRRNSITFLVLAVLIFTKRCLREHR